VRTLALIAVLFASVPAHALVWPDVPERIERDLASSDPAARRAAALGIRKLGPLRAPPLLIKALGDPDTEVRLAAADAAVQLHFMPATDIVLPWLGDHEPRVRMKGCDVARSLPNASAIPHLGRALGDSDADVREHAAEALGEQANPEAVPPLLGKLDDPLPKVRRAIVHALARLGDKRAVVPLAGKVQDSVPDVRGDIARALGDLGDPRASQALMLQLRDNVNEVRIEALSALGRLRAPDTVDAIIPLASDRTAAIRQAAIAALGSIATREAVRALVATLGFGDDAGGTLDRTTVRLALVSAGQAAVPELSAVLKNPPSTSAAISAAWVLGELGAKSESGTIVAALRKGSLPPAAGLRALAGASSADTVPVVLEFISDASPSVRAEALRAAAALLDPAQPDGRAVEPLASALRDVRLSSAERAQVATLLGRTGAGRAAPFLVALVRAKDSGIRLAAIDALGLLGPAGADEALLEALAETDPVVRLHAAIALGECGGASGRDALIAKLDASEELDRAAVLTALAGVLAREPSEAAVTRVARELEISVGAERDALIVALGRAKTPSALRALQLVVKSTTTADRATAAATLASRQDGADLLRGLLADPEPSVRGQAAWALGGAGDASDIARLEPLTKVAEPDVAANAVAAIGRIAARIPAAKGGAQPKLCALTSSPRALLRANALASLGLAGLRCTPTGETERRALDDDAEIVRAAAARALARSTAAEDRRVLDICATSDRSGSVARICRDRLGPSTKKTHATLVYVVPDAGGPPRPDAPFALATADGLIHTGNTDRRGAVFEPIAPEGGLTLVRLDDSSR
jgi:HEAT repeat protein